MICLQPFLGAYSEAAKPQPQFSISTPTSWSAVDFPDLRNCGLSTTANGDFQCFVSPGPRFDFTGLLKKFKLAITVGKNYWNATSWHLCDLHQYDGSQQNSAWVQNRCNSNMFAMSGAQDLLRSF